AFTRLYGRAPKNKRVKEGIKDVRFQRKSIVSTMRLGGEMCPKTFSGTLNKELFSAYIKVMLKPTFSAGDILLLDNSSVHHSKLVIRTLEECEIKYLFLPPYSPDFSPIELFWSYMKSILRKIKARTHEKLESGIKFVLENIPQNYIENWFKHCVYVR
ncbi:MAG: transposase, partial [Candidatus Accumulibacter sp.]|nr:transposase [Accumulibacter sp.]